MDDIVIDPANAVPQVGAETVIANHYGPHPVVRSLASEQLPVVFPLARSVAKTEKPPADWSQTVLVETSPEGWGETGLDKLDEVKKDPGGPRRARRDRDGGLSRRTRRSPAGG